MKVELNADDQSEMSAEWEMLDKIRSKDIFAFEKFYKQYFKRYYVVAFKYTRHHETSQEIVHDTFLKIWNNASVLKITVSLESYIYRSVINASLNYIKKEKRDSEQQQKFMTEFKEFDEADDEPGRLENRLILIEQALGQLPPQCKKVMIMSKYQKIKQQEIADTLGISIKTVKNHLTYGFKKIREQLVDNNAFLCFLILVIHIGLSVKFLS